MKAGVLSFHSISVAPYAP